MHFDPGILDTATNHYYRRVASSGGPVQDACLDTSNVLTIQVHPEIFNNLLEPIDTLICEGTDPGTIRPALEIGGKSGECWDTSSAILYNVHPRILNNLVTDNDTVCYNTQPLPFTQDGSSVSGGIGTYAYLWKSRTGQSGWADGSGVNNQSGYQPSTLTDTTYYSRIIESGVCIDTSNTLTVVVQDDIQNNIINGDLPTAEACENISDTITGTGSQVLTGGDETVYTYLWEKFNTGSQLWQDAPQNNSLITDSAYITEDLTVMSYYRRHVWSGACHDATDSVTLNVNPRPTITLQSVDHLVECYDGTNPVLFDIPVQLTGTPPFVVRYNKVPNDSAGISVASSNGFTVPLYSEDITDYTITITDLIDNNICFSYLDNLPKAALTAQVSRKPEPALLLAADSVCGDEMTVKSRAPISQSATGWWSTGDQGFSFNDSTSNETLMTTGFSDGQDKAETILRWSELSGSCVVEHSDSLVVFYKRPDDAAVEDENDTLYFAPYTNLKAIPNKVGQGTWTHVKGTAQIDENDLHNPNVYVSFGNSDLDEEDENVFLWTVQNVICPTTSASTTITRKDIAQYTAFSPNYDGTNDVFQLDGLHNADEFTMSIFTRQGIMIYKMEKKPGGVLTHDLWWDGKLDGGNEAADGTYFYVLIVKYAGQTYEYKGYVELVRPKI
jgi:gliding motility-associated-like protein